MRGPIIIIIVLLALCQVFGSENQPPQSSSKQHKKPGFCPKATTLHGPCGETQENSCSTDSDCPGWKKCCREGCGKVCKGLGILRDTGTWAQCWTQTGMRTEGGYDCNRWCMLGGSDGSKFYGGYCYPDGYWMTKEGKGYCWCY